MAKPLTGIAIIRCQLSEGVCLPEEWKQYITDNPDFRDFCVKRQEIIVTLIDCKGCEKNKEKAQEIKAIASQIIKEGIDTIFLTRCMCRNIEELESYVSIKGNNLGWINTFQSFNKQCIGGLEKESTSESCMLYQDEMIEKCPNNTAYHLLGFIKDNYAWVNVVIGK